MSAAQDAGLTTRLAAILARPVPPEARRRAALHLVDWLGCAAIGAVSEAGSVFAAHGRGLAPGPARAIGAGRAAAADAAFVNGAYGNVLEMDDIHRAAILHPGPVVVPAALAVAEGEGAPAEDLLDAVVRGYEAMIRVGRSMDRHHYRHWHPTATCGPFGAAAAAASLLGLDSGRAVDALGNAGTQASGPWQCRLEGVMSKQLHTARAAQAGVSAAVLARLGLTGPRAILEGPLGLYAALCREPRPERVVADPDGPWLIGETSFKPWPACRHAHPAIHAVLALRDGIRPGDVAGIAIATYGDAVAICDNPVPATTLEAKFSLQHSAAVALVHGPPPLDAFEARARDGLAALRARVTVSVDPDIDAAYPAHYGASATVRLSDGATRTHLVADALGDPENPMTDGAVLGKAGMLMAAAGVAEDRAEAMVAAALALADGAPVAALTDLFPGEPSA